MFKIGKRIEMIETCKDNPNIKDYYTGTIDFINHDNILSIEFDYPVTGNGISGNNRNNYQWFIDPKQVKLI